MIFYSGGAEVNPERRNRIVVAAIAAIIAVVAIALVLMPHDVSVTYEGNGDVDPDESSIRFYETLEITMTPDDGWMIDSVTVDGNEVTVEGNVLNYSADILDFSHHEIHVTFVEEQGPTPEPGTHTVTITHTSGGETDPSGTVTVDNGDSLTVSFNPDSGYRLSELRLDGVRVATGVLEYTLNDVTEDHTLHAVFSRIGGGGGGGTDTPATLTGIEVTTMPDNLTYSEGSVFDPTGMEVTAHYSDETHRILDNSEYTWSPSGALSTDVDTVTVTHQGMTDTVDIAVVDTDAFNIIVESYSGTRVTGGNTINFSETPGCNLTDLDIHTENIVPGISQTIVLSIANETALDLDAYVFIENIALSGGDDLADQILITATHDNMTVSSTVGAVGQGAFLDLGTIKTGETDGVTVTIEFLNLPENNEAMGESISFNMGVLASEKTDTPTP